MIDHATPFHISMRAACELKSVNPTVTQKVVLVHDTPTRKLDWPTATVGLGTTVIVVPFQVSTIGSSLSSGVLPTTTQKSSLTQETLERRSRLVSGSEIAVHPEPSSSSMTPRSGVEASLPTARQKVVLTHDTASSELPLSELALDTADQFVGTASGELAVPERAGEEPGSSQGAEGQETPTSALARLCFSTGDLHFALSRRIS